MIDRDWMVRAECRSHPDEMFFPTPTDRDGQAKAIRVCIDCQVFDQCAEYARKTQPSHGVWAATYFHSTLYHTHRTPVLKPCGTEAAYQRHLARNDNPCGPCRRAHDTHRTNQHARRSNR